MNNNIMGLIIVLLYLTGMVGHIPEYSFKANQKEDNVEIEIVEEKKSDDEKNKETEEIIKKVNKANFEDEVLHSEKVVLLEFYADWCSECVRYKPVIEEFTLENEDIKVLLLNTDESLQIAKDYNVDSVPTLLLFKDGENIARKFGGGTKEELLDFIYDSLNEEKVEE